MKTVNDPGIAAVVQILEVYRGKLDSVRNRRLALEDRRSTLRTLIHQLETRLSNARNEACETEATLVSVNRSFHYTEGIVKQLSDLLAEVSAVAGSRNPVSRALQIIEEAKPC